MCRESVIGARRRAAHRFLRARTLVSAALIGAATAGCTGVTPPVEKPPEPAVTVPAEGLQYRIVPELSELRVLVYRDGPLAALGHNHVISSSDLRGRVILADEATDSFVEIHFPVSTLEVDRPALRLEEGDDFPGQLDQDAIEGTRANMLGEQVLDAAQFPEIRLASRKITGMLPELLLEVEADVRGTRRVVEIPARVTVTSERLSATGQFELRQTDLALEPFSALLGALTVRDNLVVKFRLTAAPDSAN